VSSAGKKTVRTLLLALTLASRLGALEFGSPGDPETLAASLVAELSDREALAQTFMLGWVGADPSPLILDWIKARGIGGVKIFGWNT